MKFNLGVKSRIFLLVGMALSALCMVVLFNAAQVRTTLIEEKKTKLRHLVESSYGILEYWHGQAKSGQINEETAKKFAAESVQKLRYEKVEYFWINDFDSPFPKMVMHPTVPALNGKVLDAAKFNSATSLQKGVSGKVEPTNGKANLFVAFNEVANAAGSGYVAYDWPKPLKTGGASDVLYPKLSYVKKFDQWGWLIGTGVYIDDVDLAVSNRLKSDGLIAAAVGLLLVLISLWQARKIVNPLMGVLTESQRIVRDNDFSKPLVVFSKDEVGHVADTVNQLILKLSEVVRVSSKAGVLINESVSQIKRDADEIVLGAERQASSVTSTAAALEQISVSLSETAANSSATESAATTAVSDAEKAKFVTQSNIECLDRVSTAISSSTKEVRAISTGSEQIYGIVNVIKEIADQTNLLALNAAIEAARAGEQGRGFAVVADEVRKLAEKTSMSTQQISDLIDDIQKQIKIAVDSMDVIDQLACESAQSAKTAGLAFDGFVMNVRSAGARTQEISSAIREQDSSVQEITQQVDQYAELSRSAIDSANRNREAAVRLSGLTKDLQTDLARYKVGGF